MQESRIDTISRLQKEILPLLGFKQQWNKSAKDVNLGPINQAFPGLIFPQGAIHEFISSSPQDLASTCGFLSGILSSLMKNDGTALWISSSRLLFPPALKFFGIDPHKIIFIDLLKEKDVLWAMEEALKCEGLSAVIGEIKEIDFTSSRRMQLAVESSRVTGFVIRKNIHLLNTTASVTRWKISSLKSILAGDIPGVGFPAWNIDLLKVRNGKPGTWMLEWKAGRFKHINPEDSLQEELQKKTG